MSTSQPTAANQPAAKSANPQIESLAPKVLLGTAALLLCAVATASPAPPDACSDAGAPISVIHFFDWYNRPGIPRGVNGLKWTHKVDWKKYGLREDDVGRSRRYYDTQLDLIERLGVSAIAYQYYNPEKERWFSKPFLQSLQGHRFKIALFFDWEIEHTRSAPVLAGEPFIRPEAGQRDHLVNSVVRFYRTVPRSKWLRDREGKLPIMVFAFGFDRSAKDAAAWHEFYSEVVKRIQASLGAEPVFYWSASNAPQLEYAFQHFRDNYRAFNFVLDTPRMQLGPGGVTWNVNFDNLGVQRSYGTLRVVRDDPRYLQEMLWLAKHARPSLLFIYSWNEYFEGANIMPDQTYGTSRYRLMRSLLASLGKSNVRKMPCTLIVVDDYSEGWRTDDWHLTIEELFTLYPLRRLAPQADVRLASEVTRELLERYELVIVLAQRSDQAVRESARAAASRRVIFIGPRAGMVEEARSLFATKIERVVRNRETRYIAPGGVERGTVFLRDDAYALVPAEGVSTQGSFADATPSPLLLQRADDFWLNCFTPDDRVLAPLFERVYGRRLEPSIMYGEGLRTERLEVEPDGTVRQNTFTAPAAYEHEPLPAGWSSRPPPALPPRATR